MKVNLEQGSADWLAWRNKGIGGTDAACILGVSKWGTPLSVYVNKTTEQPKTEKTVYQEWGNRIEPLLVDKFLDDHPDITNVERGTCYMEDWMKASLDCEAIQNGQRIIIECKTGRHAAKWDPVPEDYYCQVQWQMILTGIRKAYFSVLIGGIDWFEREVEYNDDYCTKLIETCKDFWFNNVQAKVPPKVGKDGEKDYNALVALRSTVEDEKPNKEVEKSAYAKFLIAKENLEKAQAVYDQQKAQLAYLMADGSDLTFEGARIATYVSRMGSESVDKKLLKELAPDIYNRVVKRGGAVSYIKFA